MDNLKYVRQQGRDAKKQNDASVDDTSVSPITAHDCPYGPGDNRDAWLAGFGGAEEPIEQVDTSEPSSDDVRDVAPETVREGKVKDDDGEATKVVVTTTGTGETSLVTKTELANPEASDTVPNPSTTIGDPAASTNPANVQHVDDDTGRSDKAPKGAPATGRAKK